jgi:hypothetical protein
MVNEELNNRYDGMFVTTVWWPARNMSEAKENSEQLRR